MAVDERVSIGTIDYMTMFGVVILCTGVGLYNSFKKKDNQEEQQLEHYTLANRRMACFPVAVSILATKLSGISMAGGVGEEYSFGPQMSLVFVGYFFGQIIVATCFVPVLRRARYTSVYEYLEQRFDRSIRVVFSTLYICSHLIYVGIVLYVPAISVTAVSGISFEITILVIGVTCTLYCVLGGFKAIVWTDVIQTLTMFLCFILVIIQGTIYVGGPRRVWDDSLKSGFITSFTLVESNMYRYSAWAVFTTGIYTSLRDLGVGQAGVQRLLSVKTTRAAQMSTMVSGALAIIFMILLLMSSTIIYVYFHECDPVLRKNVTGVVNPDQIFAYSIVKFMGDVPGLAGIAIAGILSGAISSFSSYINAFATITLEDHLMICFPSLFVSEKRKLTTCKILTALYGILTIAFAFLVPYLGGVVKTAFSTVSVLTGPLCGVLLLGFFHHRYNRKACYLSLILSVAVCLALAISSHFQKATYIKLPVSTDRCDDYDSNYTTFAVNERVFKQHQQSAKNPFILSFMWYGPIGAALCILVGYASSYVFAPEYVNPKLLHPFVAPDSEYETETVKMNDEIEELANRKNERDGNADGLKEDCLISQNC